MVAAGFSLRFVWKGGGMSTNQKIGVGDLKEAKKVGLDDKKKVLPKEWEKPTLEDVSEKVMAQPYIRFT